MLPLNFHLLGFTSHSNIKVLLVTYDMVPNYKWLAACRFRKTNIFLYCVQLWLNSRRFRNNWERVIMDLPGSPPIPYWSPYWICTQHSTCQWSLTSQISYYIKILRLFLAKAFWLVHIFIKTLSISLLGRRFSLFYHVYQKNLALLQYHNYSGNV